MPRDFHSEACQLVTDAITYLAAPANSETRAMFATRLVDLLEIGLALEEFKTHPAILRATAKAALERQKEALIGSIAAARGASMLTPDMAHWMRRDREQLREVEARLEAIEAQEAAEVVAQ